MKSHFAIWQRLEHCPKFGTNSGLYAEGSRKWPLRVKSLEILINERKVTLKIKREKSDTKNKETIHKIGRCKNLAPSKITGYSVGSCSPQNQSWSGWMLLKTGRPISGTSPEMVSSIQTNIQQISGSHSQSSDQWRAVKSEQLVIYSGQVTSTSFWRVFVVRGEG